MNSITLFHCQNDAIKITITASFEGDALVVEGYDIGKRVEEYWGDSDYEYSMTIAPVGVEKLYKLFHVTMGDREALLQALANRYNTNTCYSDLSRFLQENNIAAPGFSWR